MVATSRERKRVSDEPFCGRLLFCIKEAVYKASYPLDGTFLDHHDVEVNFATGTAVVCSGRLVNFRYCISNHIVALAFIAAAHPVV
jgi:4'-phosphopantetheinyl transferase EntD